MKFTIFKLLKGWFRPDAHTKVARAKKRLAELERDLPLPDPPLPQRQALDIFFCRVAELLSFGKEPLGPVVASTIYTEDLNLRDFAYAQNPFWVLAEVVAPLVHIRHDLRHQGKKVIAMRAVWLNVPQKDKNPFSEIGFFWVTVYSEENSIQPPPLEPEPTIPPWAIPIESCPPVKDGWFAHANFKTKPQ